MAPAPLHLAMAFDQNYVTPFCVLLTSILVNNKDATFHFHAIATGISEADKVEIQRFVHQHRAAVSFYEISPEATEGLVLPKHLHFTEAVYYRLFFPSLVPNHVKKLLYLDTDIVVMGNVAELYHTALNGQPAGAVAEVNATANRPDLGIHETGTYFNSGVMLMDVLEWKKQKISEKAVQFLRDFPEKIVWPDQDALNVVLMNNYTKLDAKFNVLPADIPKQLPKRKYREFLSDKVVMHYTFKDHKPWNITSVSKFRYLYQNYLKQSPRAHRKKYEDFRLTKSVVKTLVKIRVLETLLNYPKLAIAANLLVGFDVANWL